MISGAHVVIYSRDAEADRNFFRDVLRLDSVDAGHGWLIFALPPAEAAFHPADKATGHELYLMCDDLEGEMASLALRGVKCSDVVEARWGSITQITLPGGGSLALYQPKHVRPHGWSASRMNFKFKTEVVRSGNATAVEIPKAGIESFGAGARPPVAISINGHRWRSRIAVKNGSNLVGISAANRAASRIAEGDLVEVLIELDEEPRTVPEPTDLSEALERSKRARAAFDKMPFGLRRKHVAAIEAAKSLQTRQRRIAKLVNELLQSAA